jgi:hypothetical protein
MMHDNCVRPPHRTEGTAHDRLSCFEKPDHMFLGADVGPLRPPVSGRFDGKHDASVAHRFAIDNVKKSNDFSGALPCASAKPVGITQKIHAVNKLKNHLFIFIQALQSLPP